MKHRIVIVAVEALVFVSLAGCVTPDDRYTDEKGEEFIGVVTPPGMTPSDKARWNECISKVNRERDKVGYSAAYPPVRGVTVEQEQARAEKYGRQGLLFMLTAPFSVPYQAVTGKKSINRDALADANAIVQRCYYNRLYGTQTTSP